MYVVYCLNYKTDDDYLLKVIKQEKRKGIPKRMIDGKVKIKEYKSFDEANEKLMELNSLHDGKLYTIIMEP